MTLRPCLRNTAANKMVKTGTVNIKVVASPTGMNDTEAKQPRMAKLPSTPTPRVISRSRLDAGTILWPKKLKIKYFVQSKQYFETINGFHLVSCEGLKLKKTCLGK